LGLFILTKYCEIFAAACPPLYIYEDELELLKIIEIKKKTC
jgi:hypothetical protein